MLRDANVLCAVVRCAESTAHKRGRIIVVSRASMMELDKLFPKDVLWQNSDNIIPCSENSNCLIYSRTSDSGPSEEGTLYVRPLYKGHCPRSQKITFPIVSIH